MTETQTEIEAEGPYLILHRVCGKPAFDIAERSILCGALTWTVCSSGHTAHPWRYWLLEDLVDDSDVTSYGNPIRPFYTEDTIPDDWPDHFSCNNRGRKVRPKADLSILELIESLK